MDHQRISQLLGNDGEFIGAIAVVITLGYLAMQVWPRCEHKCSVDSYRMPRSLHGTLLS